MPTSTKKSKPRPLASRKPRNKKTRGLGSAIGELASRLGPAKNGTRPRRPAKRGLVGIAAGAGRGTRARKPSKRRKAGTAAGSGVRFRPQRPSRKGLVGIAAGAGLGGAAMAQRRRRGHQDATNWPPGETSAAPIEAVPTAAHGDDANDPDGGARHEDPKGPDFAGGA
jgi:hypothetical protein